MDLIPGPEIYEAAARAWSANSPAAVHGDWSQRDEWPARLQDNENLRRIVDSVWGAAYRAGREDAARAIEEVAEEAGWGEIWAHCVSLARGSTSLGRSSQGVGDNPEEQRP